LDLDKYQIDLNAALDREKMGLDKYQFDTTLAYDKARDKVSDDQFKQNLVYDYAALNAKTGDNIKPTGDDTPKDGNTSKIMNSTSAAIAKAYSGMEKAGMKSESIVDNLKKQVESGKMSEELANKILKNLGLK
jgi:hypothetical protein